VGLFQKIFKNELQPNLGYRYQLIVDKGNGFYSWNGKSYQSDIVRACIRPKARAIGKLVAKHIRDGKDGPIINPEPYIRFLLEEPNPYMTGQMMQEKLATQLMLNNNAYAWIFRDENGYATQIYPVSCSSVEVVYSSNGDMQFKFTLLNGKVKTANYADVIHLRRDFNENDVFGDNPSTVITSLMDIVTTTDQGIIKAIRNSAVVRWIMMFKSTIRPEDKTLKVKDFAESYMDIDNSAGVATSDPTYDLKEVTPQNYVPNAAQIDKTMQRIFNFFNTNEKILQSKWGEDDWNAYYEAEIEPDAMQMSGEYTRKLFSRKERGFGNQIIFVALNLQYASMNTKLQLMQMVDRGAMTPNEWRTVLNMGPIEGGDKPIRRLDTAVVQGGGAK